MKLQPILLIHGFNGSPHNWTGPADRFPDFLSAHGYDPALIRVFDYGYDENDPERRYNNLGDMRQIAHRLDEGNPSDPAANNYSVDRLSYESVMRGGPPKVTIIAHSSGGLIARYYLTRQTEDEFGTRYRGNVGRVIFLGTPHQGVDIEDLLDPLPTNFLIYRLMLRLHYLFPPSYHEQSETLREMFHGLKQSSREPLSGSTSEASETPALKEMHPGSAFLQEINHPGAMPREIEYVNIIGDVRGGVIVKWANRVVWTGERSFGDMLVSTHSAGTIPNAPSRTFPLVEKLCLEVDLRRRSSRLVSFTATGEHPTPIHRWLRSLPAARQKILDTLNSPGDTNGHDLNVPVMVQTVVRGSENDNSPAIRDAPTRGGR